ncbi:MAG: hypothetical protein JW750_11050 [Anaerolineaceae bacterium]|nr:hypothetical protein [Anaerolineaceae bacterium]
MAKNTSKELRNLTIYQVWVRNHGPNGTFKDVEADLDRIRSLGVDVLYLMPIYPIGKAAKKGKLGSPYSIADYRGINPEFGTRDDFHSLIDAAHERGMKVMIDIVFNHTAHDSNLIKEHPNWYNVDENGRPYTTVPAWSDIIDLKHPNLDLWDYLVETLVNWVKQGVDGFRCDVASIVPIKFWRHARKQVKKVNPNVIWLAESVHMDFVRTRRNDNLYAVSDSEVYRAFDMCYDYDIWNLFQYAVTRQLPVERYFEMLLMQDSIYPKNYVKMRCVENHDQPRIMSLAPDYNSALAWTAFAAFNRGPFFVYAGQESAADHTPSLFDLDPVEWGSYELQDFITRLNALKKEPAQYDGKLFLLSADPVGQAAWYNGSDSLYGVFNFNGETGETAVQVPDGDYQDLISGQTVTAHDGKFAIPDSAVIFRYAAAERPREIRTRMHSFEIH